MSLFFLVDPLFNPCTLECIQTLKSGCVYASLLMSVVFTVMFKYAFFLIRPFYGRVHPAVYVINLNVRVLVLLLCCFITGQFSHMYRSVVAEIILCNCYVISLALVLNLTFPRVYSIQGVHEGICNTSAECSLR